MPADVAKRDKNIAARMFGYLKKAKDDLSHQTKKVDGGILWPYRAD
jgi:hypothetical protein